MLRRRPCRPAPPASCGGRRRGRRARYRRASPPPPRRWRGSPASRRAQAPLAAAGTVPRPIEVGQQPEQTRAPTRRQRRDEREPREPAPPGRQTARAPVSRASEGRAEAERPLARRPVAGDAFMPSWASVVLPDRRAPTEHGEPRRPPGPATVGDDRSGMARSVLRQWEPEPAAQRGDVDVGKRSRRRLRGGPGRRKSAPNPMAQASCTTASASVSIADDLGDALQIARRE